jgi:hypothetical protein
VLGQVGVDLGQLSKEGILLGRHLVTLKERGEWGGGGRAGREGGQGRGVGGGGRQQKASESG